MDQPTLHHTFVKQQCCVVIPTYNNAMSIAAVIRSVLQYTSNIIVVNDGSTDNSFDVLKDFSELTIVHHPKNKGKGMALRTGFKVALEQGYTHAISIDADGQHFPDDLHLFLNQIEKTSNAIVIGARNMDQPGIPPKSSFGNRVSSFWFWVVTGIRLSDTQSGYRLYPLIPINNTKFITRKYEFEIEVMVRSFWKGVQILSIPVKVYYPPVAERVTHFRPFTDVSRIVLLNIVFVLSAAFWFTPKRIIQNFSFKTLKKKLYDNTIGSSDSIMKKSLSMGFGVFMGIAPFWGYQIWLAIAIAHFIKLNKVIVGIFTNISIPPFIPFILYGSYYLGTVLLDMPSKLDFSMSLTLKEVWYYLHPYLYGSFLLATFMGFFVFMVSYSALYLKRLISNKKNLR